MGSRHFWIDGPAFEQAANEAERKQAFDEARHIAESNKHVLSKVENFRIEDVRKAVVNGKSVKLFNAYQKIDKAFVFAGQFSAPIKTANKDLWKLLIQ